MLHPGLYDQIISQSLSRELASVPAACQLVEKLDAAEAPQALAGYVAEAVRAALEAMPSGTEEQEAQRIALVNQVLEVLAAQREDLGERSVDSRAEKLLQILRENDPGRITGLTAAAMPRPETPMAVSSLFTGAAHEPQMYSELQKEIASADRIDMLVSFVKWSGLRLLIDVLKDFAARGGLLRVITTSYMGATEVKAVDELAALPGAEVRVSYDTARTVLDNISRSFRGHGELVSRIRSFTEDSGQALSFAAFLRYHHLTPGDVYGKGLSFARLCVEAGVRPEFREEAEAALNKALYRFAAFDSRRWITFLLNILPRLGDINFAALPPLEQRMMRMFYMTVWDSYADDWDSDEVLERLYSLADSHVMLSELMELLRYQFNCIDFVDAPADLGFDCPLDVHCTYTQRQLLSALDYRNYSAMRQGVLYLPEKKIDVFLITLNKSDKDYSPTTMYEDYAVSPTLFHWQSQSTTAADSPTGRRYIHHAAQGGRVLLFVREFKQDALGTAPYTFLGQASYVSHSGSKPMNILWQLERPIPAKYLRKVQQVVG
ncbi:MAG: DUF3427 domain-containing protein [Clostridia bacterium]|nr:DUF3427 domain-containing protein [Clostridia bacterium]